MKKKMKVNQPTLCQDGRKEEKGKKSKVNRRILCVWQLKCKVKIGRK